MHYTFSIILPVYNVSDYLEQCLNSIIGQLEDDCQVILIDDGSNDGSESICDRFAELVPQIEVYHQQNKGVAAARNEGLRRAKGEYILWVDPDDWVAENWLREIRKVVEKSKPDMVLFDYIERDGSFDQLRKYGRVAGKLNVECILLDLERDIELKSALWNKVIRKDIYAGIRFDETLKLLEDYDLIHWLFMKMDSIEYLDSPIYNYRIRKEGLTWTRGLDVSYNSVRVAKKRKREIEDTGRRCSPIGVAIQARWFCYFYCLNGMPKAFRRENRDCQREIRKAFSSICQEKSFSLKAKIEYLVFACPAGQRLYRWRFDHKKMKGGD